AMSAIGPIPKSWRGGGLAVALLALTACTALTSSKIAESQTARTPAPAVGPVGADPHDVEIGRREHARAIVAYGGVHEDREPALVVARIVGRLLAAASQPNAQFQVTMLDTSEVNAFALPGGFVYVTRGLLALASDASQLAAVLAHEIAHVTLRH